MTIISASANCNANPDLACSRILSDAGLKAWWVGGVKILEFDPTWPALGTKMSWRAGGGTFKATIKSDARPLYIEMSVNTPSAESIIRHTFERLPDGGTCYTKSVEPLWRSGIIKFLSPLLIPLLRASVKKEVRNAVRFADMV